MPVTLEQLLQSRDNRAKHQKDLLGEYPGRSLLCMTVQLPGPEKRNRMSLAIAKAGVQAIREAFEPTYEELKDLETGYEAYFLVDLPALETKKRACQIEDTHPLGRLMDIDVLTLPVSENPPSRPVSGNYFSQGFAKNQFPETSTRPARVETVSRLDIGLEARRCLLCGNEVRYCMRAKTHSKEELLSRIEQMLKEYELQAPNPRTD
jgi:holo-ACP synthase CitX